MISSAFSQILVSVIALLTDMSTRPHSLCSILGCSSPAVARTYCRSHYARWYQHGDPLSPIKLHSYGASSSVTNNTRVKFTPALWDSWLAAKYQKDENTERRARGIAEMRNLLLNTSPLRKAI